MSKVDDREVISDEVGTEIWISEELGTTMMDVQDEEHRVTYILTPYTARKLISLVERWLESPAPGDPPGTTR